MSNERLASILALGFVAGCALIGWGLGFGKLAAFAVGVALVFASTALISRPRE